jgi:hypothetical protein
MPLVEVLSVGPVVAWCGTGRRWTKRLVELARLRESRPTLRLLAARWDLDVPDDSEWNAITWTRLDGGVPVAIQTFPVTPLGRLADADDA